MRQQKEIHRIHVRYIPKQTKEHAIWQGSSKSEHPFSTLNREKCVFT